MRQKPDSTLMDECVCEIPEIEILFADPPVIGQVLSQKNVTVKWIQNTFAGVDAIMKEISKLEKSPSCILTRQTDGFGQLMGEYVIAQIIARERNFTQQYDLQKTSCWDQKSHLVYRGLHELSLGIIGLGTIGKEVARQCKAMNMTVWAAVRDERFQADLTCSGVDHIRPISRLNEMLRECNYLVNVVPSTPATQGMLSGEVFKVCAEKKTVFINIGRGDIIDDNSLVNAIRCGWLGGAILDVFNIEPLPASHPLWTLPGVTISPHVSGATQVEQAVKTFVDNLASYESGKSLPNEVDFFKGY